MTSSGDDATPSDPAAPEEKSADEVVYRPQPEAEEDTLNPFEGEIGFDE